MEPSIQLFDFTKDYEQLHDGDLHMIGLQPKPDARGIWTEGFGHAMRGFNGRFLTTKNCSFKEAIKRSKIKTEEEAFAMLRWDVKNIAEGVFRRIHVPLCQHQFDALVSHAYNCGYSQTMHRLVNTRAAESKIKEWFTKHYITAGGIKLRGLVLRRHDEYQMWSEADYKRSYQLETSNKIT